MANKILIVDDEPQIVSLIKSRLEANHYEVLTASDGEEGLQKFEDEKPDVIILDIGMPKVDGYTFVLRLKQMPDVKTLPIIILTARAKMQDLFKIEGVKDYLLKPFKAEELLEKIKQHIGSAQDTPSAS